MSSWFSADYIEWKDGRRITGLVYAGVLFAIKMGIAFGGGVIDWLLAFYGFEANAAPTERSLLGIRLAFAVVPAAFSFAAVFLLCLCRLTDSQVSQIEADLRQRREASRD